MGTSTSIRGIFIHADNGTEWKRWNRHGHWRACYVRRIVRLRAQRGRVGVLKHPSGFS